MLLPGTPPPSMVLLGTPPPLTFLLGAPGGLMVFPGELEWSLGAAQD
ncbi:MAG: hypothetical protein L0215_17220 [Gemmataceae bacterium]|nr:hypothetical protein [Gemmataceae bacterium]